MLSNVSELMLYQNMRFDTLCFKRKLERRGEKTTERSESKMEIPMAANEMTWKRSAARREAGGKLQFYFHLLLLN